jgi:hypothetical protein
LIDRFQNLIRVLIQKGIEGKKEKQNLNQSQNLILFLILIRKIIFFEEKKEKKNLTQTQNLILILIRERNEDKV